MSYTTAVGTTIRISVAGADSTRSDIDGVSGALQNADQTVSGLTRSFASFLGPLAGATAAYLGLSEAASSVGESIERMAQLDDAAQKTGSSIVESLSRIQKVAGMTGTDFGVVDKAIFNLAKTMGGTDDESKKLRASLAQIGITTEELEGMDAGAMFIRISKALQGYGDDAGKSAVLTGIFKKQAEELAPFLNDVAESVDKFQSRSAESAAAAALFQDNLGIIKVRSNELFDTLTDKILPVLNQFTGTIANGGGVLGDLTVTVNELANSGALANWAENTAAAFNLVTSTIVPGAKVAAAYFAIFVAAPALYTAVAGAMWTLTAAVATYAMNVLVGQAGTLKFNTALFGTSVQAELAAGSLTKLQLAGQVMFAAFAGWQLGTWLSEEFVEVRIAGLAFVGAMLTGWEHVRFAAEMAWEGIKFAWDSTINGMRTTFAAYLSLVGAGLAKIGATQTAGHITAFADELRQAAGAQQSFGERTAGLTAAHHAALDAIDKNIVELVQYELSTGNAATAQAAATEQKKVGIKASADNTEALKKEAEGYSGLISGIRAKIAENRLELALGENASDSQKAAIKLDQELAAGKLVLTSAHLAAVRAALAEQAATEQLLKIQKTEKDVFGWIVQNTQARLASKTALQGEYEMYGLSADARELANVGLKAEAELEKFLADARKAGKTITDEMLGQLRTESELRATVERATLAQTKALAYATQLVQENARFAAESLVDERDRAAALLAIDAKTWEDRIALAGEGTEAQRHLAEQYTVWYANQLAKPVIDEQRNAVAKYGDIFRTGFADMLNNGKAGWSSFTKSLTTTFKTTVADQIYKMFAQPFVVKMVASLLGVIGGGSGPNAAGGTGQMGSLLQTGKSLYDAISTGFTGLSASLGGMVSTVGNFFGSASVSGFGAGMGMTGAQATAAAQAYGAAGMTGTGSAITAGAATGAMVTAAAGIAAGVLGGRALSGGYSAFGGSGNSAVNAGTAVGAVVGSVVPVIGTAIGALVGGLLGGAANRLFGHKPKEVTSQGIKGSFGTDSFTGTKYENWTQKGGLFRSDKSGTNTANVSDEVGKQLTDSYNAIKAVTMVFAKTMGEPVDAIKNFTKDINLTLSGDAEKDKQAFADLLNGIGDDLARNLVPNLAGFAVEGEAASATLQRLATNYASLDSVLNTIGLRFGAVGVTSLAARERLIELSGGLEALASNVGGFAQNYLTDSERLAPVAEAVSKALADMGLSGVNTRDKFKAVVMGLDKTTEAGAKQFAAMIGLQEAFAAVYPAIEDTAAAVRSAGDVAQERARLQKELDQFGMSQAERERAQIDATNRALYDLLQSRTAEQQAAEAIAKAQAEAAATLASANKAYEGQIATILKSRMSETQLRALETKGMDASTVALYDRLAALNAEEKAVADLRTKLASITGARGGISDQIFTAMLGGKDVQGKIDQLKGAESKAWSQLTGGGADVALLEKIKDLAFQRIALEGELHDKTISDLKDQYDKRKEGLTAELASMLKMREFAVQLKAFTGSLKLSDLSILNPKEKLAEAEAQYRTTLEKARQGDANAQGALQGAAQNYLQLQKQFSGSTQAYASVYAGVVEALERFSSNAPTDPQIENQRLQISVIESTSANLNTTMRDTSNKQVEVLRQIDAALARAQTNTEAQLVQAGAVSAALVTEMQKNTKKLAEIESRIARMEAA